MKKRSIFVLALVLVLCLSACGKKTASGALHISLADDIHKETYQSVDEKTIDAQGETVALFTDGLLLNFVLEHGAMNSDGNSFTPDKTIFSCPELTNSQLLEVKTFFGDVNPTLRVSFDGPSGREEYFLFQSGDDGSIVLIPSEEMISSQK